MTSGRRQGYDGRPDETQMTNEEQRKAGRKDFSIPFLISCVPHYFNLRASAICTRQEVRKKVADPASLMLYLFDQILVGWRSRAAFVDVMRPTE